MEALIRDDFQHCIELLQRGMERNTTNAPLNRDMQLVIDKARAALEARVEVSEPKPVDEATAVRTDFSAYGQTRQ